ncbi:retinol dehydrogenase 13-like isoform X2 [Belonocnema kinseyi]|uniref:retinol dehydrogenase 13-like isoform X2 n=1 Tax=Belonocnema kinseyi TaxID=2817044 RepID=UPI00143D3B19|nr:retinol dehydrogenase 13-like isoform X2 [Belonocnema kinseyi]
MNQYQNVEKIFEDFRPYLDSYWVYVVGIILGILTAIRSYMGGSECPSNQRIDGKIVLITGASSGIGKETAIELGRRGGRIILAVKNTVSGNKVAEKIRSISNGKAEVKCVDLSSLKSVQNLVKNLVDRIDILINNAGIAFHPFEKTEEGFEMHFATNYLGHFLLTQLLLPKLKKSDQGRIINLSARAHMLSSINLDDLNQEQKFTARGAFAQSKLALVLMTIYMSSLLKDNTKITINAVDPGLVRGTGNTRRSPISSTYLMKTIMQPWMWLLLKNPVEGAQTSIYLAVSPDLVNQTGKYFSDCELKTPSENAENDYLSKELYEKSMALIQPYMSLKNSNLSS